MSSRSATVAAAVVVCAGVLGVLSIVSDAVPFDLGSKSISSIALFGIAVIANDIVSWFVLSMLVGRIGGKSAVSAGLIGAAFSLTAIVVYLAGDSFLHGHWDPSAIGNWMVAAGVGGGLGGCVGWLGRYCPVLLTLPMGLAVFRIVSMGEAARSTMLGSWVACWCVIVLVASGGYALDAVLLRRRRVVPAEGVTRG